MSLIDDMVVEARARARTLSPRQPRPTRARHRFDHALRGRDALDVIAEFKQRSPSLGAIAERGLEARVRRYVDAGAAAVSVLTEPDRFGGSYADLELAARTVDAPVLMKDFVVEPVQAIEAAHLGASAVLLIVRCLSPAALRELADAVVSLGMTPLVECHEASEMERALEIDEAVIGVNNRDLDSLEVDRSRAPALLREVPRDRVVVAESGYESAEDVREIRGVADAVLIGSALMKLDDPAERIREIRERGAR